jgi:hypothetical protein
MSAQTQNYFGKNIVWKKGSNPQYPYVTDFEGKKCVIRLNDFPEEHLYTLIVDGVEIENFDDYPDSLMLERSIKRLEANHTDLNHEVPRTEEMIYESPNSNVIWLKSALALQKEVEVSQKNLQRREFQWQEYKNYLDLYKYYLDLGLKAVVFFYLLTGGTLAFYLPNKDVPYIKFSLLVPIFISVILGLVFIYGAMLWRNVTRKVIEIIEELNKNDLNCRPRTDIHLLSVLLILFGFLFLFVGIFIFVLWNFV